MVKLGVRERIKGLSVQWQFTRNQLPRTQNFNSLVSYFNFILAFPLYSLFHSGVLSVSSVFQWARLKRLRKEKKNVAPLKLSLVGSQTYELLVVYRRTLLSFWDHNPNSPIYQENKIHWITVWGIWRTFLLPLSRVQGLAWPSSA